MPRGAVLLALTVPVLALPACEGGRARFIGADGGPSRDVDLRRQGDGGPDAGTEGWELALWHEVPLGDLAGTYVSLGDLDGDRRVDLLVHRMGRLTVPAHLAAIDFDGALLWEVGDATLSRHRVVEPSNEMPCRGIAFVYDIDFDAQAEVVAELWQGEEPRLVILDGATGDVERSIPSPFPVSVRLPEGYTPTRGHPVGAVAFLQGRGRPPAIVLKYESSSHIPGHVVALTSELETLWHVTLDPHGVGHVISVADIDDDGREEVIAGEAALDDDGRVLWQQTLGNHADITAVADVHPSPGVEVLMSICQTGPAVCLTSGGETLWSLSAPDVSHGQGLWLGDFVPEEPGLEVIVLRSGHLGEFLTARGEDGRVLARWSHAVGPLDAYPDLPLAVRWTGPSDRLWVPADRALVDGRGQLVQTLERYDDYVVDVLHPGTSREELAVQAFALDICGSESEELVLYHPYAGEAVLVFTGEGEGCADRPYVHQRGAYNIRSYF